MSQFFSTQTAFGDAIVKVGARFRNVVVNTVRDAGLKTNRFEQQFSDRFYDFEEGASACVVASAGMTVRGKVPFVCASAVTLMGCYEAIRNSVCVPNVNVKFIGTLAGFSLDRAGGSVQCFEDFACFSALPQMKVFCPSDYWETLRVLEFIAQDYGPAYVRLSTVSVPEIHNQSFSFQSGKPVLVKEGTKVMIIATGTMVSASLRAAEILEKKGFSVGVVDCSSIKPLDRAFFVDLAPRVHQFVTVEEHSVIGGLGSVIQSILSGLTPRPVRILGMQDVFGESGAREDLYRVSGLSSELVAAQIEKLL